jgi:hypothetical protein
VQEEVLVAV